MRKIALEEHFFSQQHVDYLRSRKDFPRLETVEGAKGGKVEKLYRTPSSSQLYPQHLMATLLDVGPARLADMDAAGISMQVLSTGPGVEEFDVATGTALARDINDELAETVRKHPDRYAGLAGLAYGDPEAAARELERCVTKLGLKGAKLNSHVGGEYLDDKKFWVLFETAERLDVPIYLHAKEPPPGLLDLLAPYPVLTQAAWGFAADTGLHAMRLICSGLFETYPRLKLLLGHLGEAIPFWLWRIDNNWLKGPRTTPKRLPSDYFKGNVYVTTSGMFSASGFQCVYENIGADSILFAVDYPYQSNAEGAKFMESVAIPEFDREKIAYRNAQELLSL
jgi:5-carboxyvanillate decarboxylase